METKMKHTPGPWQVIRKPQKPGKCYPYTNGKPLPDFIAVGEAHSGATGYICQEVRISNAARIVACVNACEGIADPSVIPEMMAALKKICIKLADAKVTGNGMDTGAWLMVSQALDIATKAASGNKS